MARPAHPTDHDPRIIQLLETLAFGKEVLVPCPDRATWELLRSRMRELLRAHKLWETGKYLDIKPRFKKIDSQIAAAQRLNYSPDVKRFPLTFYAYTGDILDEVLPQASSSKSPVPLAKKTEMSPPAPVIEYDEAAQPFEPPSVLDIFERYKKQ